MKIKKFIRIEDCYFDVMEVTAVTMLTTLRSDGSVLYTLKICFHGSHAYEVHGVKVDEIRKLFKYTIMQMEQACKEIAEIS